MDDKTRNTRPPLEPPTFSEPACRCESQAVYTNPDTGQVFQLTAGGADPQVLKTFLDGLKVSFVVKPGSAEPPFEEEEQSAYGSEEHYPGEPPAITLKVDVLDTAGIEPPYTVDFAIDPVISVANRLSPQSFTYSGRWISVFVHADDGSMNTSLSGVSFPRFTFVAKNGPALRSMAGSSPGGNVGWLTVSVSGSGTFDLSGSYGS